MNMRRSASALLLTAALSTFAFAPSLYAQDQPPDETEQVSDADKAKANRLFQEGQELMGDRKYDAACAKFDESYALLNGVGTLFNLADCNEKRGKYKVAYDLFGEVIVRSNNMAAALQGAAGKPEDIQKWTNRVTAAEGRQSALAKKLVKIKIMIPSGASSKVKVVKIDGQIIPPDQYGVELVYDPGAHVVMAETTNDAGDPYEEELDLDEGTVESISIPVKPGAKKKVRVGMIVGGGVTALAGVGLLGTAVYLGEERVIGTDVAIGVGLLGVVCLGVGIPVFAVGFKKKAVRGGAADDMPMLEPSPIPEVAVGPTGATFTWQF